MCASAIPLADKGVPDLPLSCITQLHFGAVPDLQPLSIGCAQPALEGGLSMSDSMNIQLNLFSANPSAKTPKNKLPEAIPVSVPKAIVQIAPPDKAVPGALQPIVQESTGPYLSDTAVAQRYAVSRPTIWRWTKSLANFPQPAKLSPGTTRWRLTDLQAFDRTQFDQMSHPVTRSKK